MKNAIPVHLRVLVPSISPYLSACLYIPCKIKLDISPFRNPDIWLQHVGHF